MNYLLPLFLKFRHTTEVLNECASTLQVVVIGPKNAGKSAIIECLLGHFFIPRDKAILCPLVINVKYNEAGLNYFTFEDSSNKKLTDLNEVAKEICQKSNQSKFATSGRQLAPICVGFHCQHIVDMSFIEPETMPMDNKFVELEHLYKSYLSLENTIALVVIPAHNYFEFKNSGLYKITEVFKSHTIILFTHLDSFESTPDLQNFFDNLQLEDFLHVGGVFCGPDKSFKGKKKIEDIRKIERRFFRSKNLPYGHLHGIEKLLQIISQYIKHRMQVTLPKYLHSLNLTIYSLKTGLTSRREENLDADKIILEEITRYVNHFNSLLSGRNLNIDTNTLVGGGRISYAFREHFSNSLDAINPLAGLSRPKILAALRNTCGTRPEVLFVSEACFETLARKQVSLLKGPCYQCVELVYEEMVKLKTDCLNCLKNNTFPYLSDVLMKTTADLINKRYSLCSELVEELLNMELAFISTVDSDFEKNVELEIANWIFTLNPTPISKEIPKVEESDPRLLTFGGSNWLSCLLSSKFTEKANSDVVLQSVSPPTSPNVNLISISPRDDADCELLENLVVAYFSTVRRSLKDSIPKAIMLRMVNFVRDNLYHTLLERILQEKHHVTDFINGVSEKRKEKIVYLQQLCECKKILEEIKNQL